MEVLKTIYTATALVGIHITRPFHSLILDPLTTYTTLLSGFKSLYQELTSTQAKDMVTKEQIFQFVSKDVVLISQPE